ncbi:hypothetical protein [Nocardia lijiangensis]|uniref:hypothetical protein n=1 Tax=Nocardia lijiangensis TaxID=299618 RepID=UPI003D73E8E5
MSAVLNIIPVGLSILDELDTTGQLTPLAHSLDPHALGSGNDVVRNEIKRHLAANHVIDLPALLGPAHGLPRSAYAEHHLCAEWTALAVEHNNPVPGDPDDGHAYVYLASDTNKGLRAATLLAAGSAEHPHQLRYIDDTTETAFRESELVRGHAYICRIPGLDPSTTALPPQTWRAFGSIGRAAAVTATARPDQRWRIALHLSGGQKAMLPYLLGVAEATSTWLRQNRTRTPIRAWCTHDERRTERLELPVRWMSTPLYDTLVKLKAAAPENGATIGSDYRNLDGSCLDNGTLTALGRIMLAALPDPGTI